MFTLDVIQHVARSIHRARNKKKSTQKYWRPTVAVIVTKSNSSQVLFVLSSGSGTWSPPKGGIEDSDKNCLQRAALRELSEEVRLSADSFVTYPNCRKKLVRYLGSKQDKSRPEFGFRENNLQLGKNMHCVHMIAYENCVPVANRNEYITKYVWIDSLDSFQALQMPPFRRKIWFAAMRAAGVSWAQPQKNKGRYE